MRVLTVGHVTHDRYASGLVAGGCAFYGARVYRQLGADVHLTTVVGEDFECEGAIADLDRTERRAGRTTLFTNSYPADAPRIQLLEAQAPMVRPDDAPSAWLDADLVHLAPVLQEVDLVAWKQAVDPGLLAIGVQGWIKVAGAPIGAAGLTADDRARGVPPEARRVVQQPWSVTVDQLAGVDAACLSTEDLIAQPGLLDRLTSAIPIVACTRGADGLDLWVDGVRTRIGAYPGAKVTDPTGAGDVFAASFLDRLARGHDPVQAARFGVACASIVIEGTGPAALDRLDEAEARMVEIGQK